MRTRKGQEKPKKKEKTKNNVGKQKKLRET